MNALGRCKICKHSKFDTQLGLQGLFCHAIPPTLTVLPGNQPGTLMFAGLWPPVDDDQNCAKFEVYEEAREERTGSSKRIEVAP